MSLIITIYSITYLPTPTPRALQKNSVVPHFDGIGGFKFEVQHIANSALLHKDQGVDAVRSINQI
ncbi:MAG: hypothetical protein IPP36_10575 [Nitrosomonadales bacterium]|nr:hypothetical protein [Nitrosomonadales bacterium]